jgi:hypothetical protein
MELTHEQIKSTTLNNLFKMNKYFNIMTNLVYK